MSMKLSPTYKQYLALMYLGVVPLVDVAEDGSLVTQLDEEGRPKFDMVTSKLWYGGAAGGWKTHLWCEWLTINCLKYPWSRWFIGRKELKTLKKTVLPTLYKILNSHDLKQDRDYNYNEVKSEFNFTNGSQILLLDLLSKPSDPLFTEYGSLEVTWGWFEEANELEENAYEILQSRCRQSLEEFCPYCAAPQTVEGNYIRTEVIVNPNPANEDDHTLTRKIFNCHECKREHFGLLARTLCTFNPDKWWVYNTFYKPFRDKELPFNVKFIPALVTDNPHGAASYIQTLQGLRDKVKRERLLKGNFEYDDTPWKLFEYDALIEMFNRPTQTRKNEKRYEEEPMYKNAINKLGKCDATDYEYWITCDPARFGEDLAVIGLWNKLSLEKIVVYFKSDLYEDLHKKITALKQKYNVYDKRIIVDSDGVGWGLVDTLKCKWFVNNASAIQPKNSKKDPLARENYANLKTQCYFELAEQLENLAISIASADIEVYGGVLSPEKIKSMLIEELDAVVQVDMDKDGTTKIMKKEDMKKKLWRSPNFADMMMMRMYGRVKPWVKAFVYW